MLTTITKLPSFCTTKQLEYSGESQTALIECLTVLLEYIDIFCDMTQRPSL